MLCELSKHNKKGVNSASQNIEGMVSFEKKKMNQSSCRGRYLHKNS